MDLTQAVEGPPQLAIVEGIATITLNRASRRHSLCDADLQALRTHILHCNTADEVRAVVLAAAPCPSSQGDVFSAGYDLNQVAAEATGAPHFEAAANALAECGKPSVAALTGHVLGGAVDLALACDFRVACEGSHWRIPAASLGIHLYAGAFRRLRLLGIPLLRRMLLLTQPVSAEDLWQRDWLESVVPVAEVADEALQLAQRLAAMPASSLLHYRSTLAEMAGGTLDEAVLAARERLSWQSSEFAANRARWAARKARG